MTFFRELLNFFITRKKEIFEQTIEHIWITLISLIIATLIGVTIGILLTRFKKFTSPVLGFVNIIQTIPSLALLGFLLPIFGIGALPAIIALFLYALLPIVRNTYTGIKEINPSVTEAARGMGLSDMQRLTKVELPLAIPTIFAGIRTAMVINIGIATLCALIAAGGLGEFIFRGIALNNVTMILAGAIPASLLAITFDFLLSIIQKHITRIIKPVLVVFSCMGLLAIAYSFIGEIKNQDQFIAGFNSEFLEREDGYQGLRKAYPFSLNIEEMDIGLMYEAINSKKVDLISGFSTDGRIKAYNLRVLDDDKAYFPPYYAAPIIRTHTLRKYPEIKEILEKTAGKISENEMRQMNYEVDVGKSSPRKVAEAFLKKANLKVVAKKNHTPDITIGSKNFTESFILAELYAILIESYSDLTIELKEGFGGTKLIFDAMKNGSIDIYPEYTGTALLVLLKPQPAVMREIIRDEEKVYEYVKQNSKEEFNVTWLRPHGFNNTTALMMREKDAEALHISSISDLNIYLDKK